MEIIAMLTIVAGVLSLMCLLILHFVSPEYKPNWRMVSEYALGKHKWLITSFFILWGASSILLAILLWNVVTTKWVMVGVLLLLVSAIGEIMGGLFDVKHKLHGMAFLLGVPSLPIAALLIGYNLVHINGWNSHRALILNSSHITWISLVVMGVSMAVMISDFKKAGIPMDRNAKPPEHVPEGVLALAGYANRILIACYIGWLMLIAGIYLSL